MALKPNANATAAQFETEVDTDGLEAVETVTAETGAASTSTALAKPAGTALTASVVIKGNVISDLQDAFRVEFDSLPAISATQGSFFLKADDTDIGSEFKMQLLSYQQSWVASPNDNKADIELVKWADNSKTSRDGVDLLAHIEDLKAQGYSKAKIQHRVILVGELLESAKGAEQIGELVMIDLPDSGRKAFNTYALQASYAVAKGRKTQEEASILTLKAVPEKTKSGDKYTKVVIS